MTTIAERAAAAAGRTEPAAGPAEDAPPAEDYTPVTSPMVDFEPGEDDPDMVPVHLAWLRVRKDIRGIAKGEEYNDGYSRYNFRGVDATVQAFAPVTMRHGVNVIPHKVDATYRDTKTAKGKATRECTVTVTWHIIGPRGDVIVAQSQGEALDSGDKGTAKAQSVALRVLLLNGGLVPTGDPDPGSSTIDRGEASVRSAVSYLDEICDPNTSAGRLRQIHFELKQGNLLGALITNEVGVEEAIGEMVVRIGKERAAGGGA
ncbi:ERF family protein [Streptomyces griseorubiginosus]|uniref:ERF family protein n=1 Tax=Streptomyces griseorubiginosus TaxID=67304 RepID=UPI0036E0333F